jgi:hypothetical protein
VVNLIAMSEVEEVTNPPSLVATVVGHFLIGLLVLAVTKTLFKQKLVVAVVAALVAYAVHRNFDAPVARKLSDLGL